jgi:hypothetical protein
MSAFANVLQRRINDARQALRSAQDAGDIDSELGCSSMPAQ